MKSDYVSQTTRKESNITLITLFYEVVAKGQVSQVLYTLQFYALAVISHSSQNQNVKMFRYLAFHFLTLQCHYENNFQKITKNSKGLSMNIRSLWPY